jgi:predicted nucleotidyltransferase
VLARATKLSPQAIRNVLADLTAIGIVESIGQERAVLYRMHTAHPLQRPLAHLFEEEENRVTRVFSGLREAATIAVPDALAVWVYGSTARGEDDPASDLDIVLVVSATDVESAVAAYRESLNGMMETERVPVSVVGLSQDDVRRLAAGNDPWWRSLVSDTQPVLGSPPDSLAARLAATRNTTRVA